MKRFLSLDFKVLQLLGLFDLLKEEGVDFLVNKKIKLVIVILLVKGGDIVLFIVLELEFKAWRI